jgi:hypothetical protein
MYLNLQAPFNSLEYDIIGDGNAQTFFTIDRFNGRISLQSSISGDTTDTYYVRHYLVLGT